MGPYQFRIMTMIFVSSGLFIFSMGREYRSSITYSASYSTFNNSKMVNKKPLFARASFAHKNSMLVKQDCTRQQNSHNVFLGEVKRLTQSLQMLPSMILCLQLEVTRNSTKATISGQILYW